MLLLQRRAAWPGASQKLFITQPALSKALTKVEEELGETLFTRRPSGLELTYAGECFLRKAYQILKLYSDVDMEFCELNQMRKGILKVGSADRLGLLCSQSYCASSMSDTPISVLRS